MKMQVDLIRPFWTHKIKYDFDITVLICQRRTKDLTQLCIESLLTFYPGINILAVDGHSEDDSTLYLKYKALTCDNFRLWERPEGVNSHGFTMDEAIRKFITTEYVLLMDSDVITMRGGWIEKMFEVKGWYAIGTLMLQSRIGEACRPPENENDILPYAHPSCSIYHVPTYKTLRPFWDHGAPCVWNMVDAQDKGLKVEYFTIDEYVIHLSGASWCVPKTIWSNDNGVHLRPFITFILVNNIPIESLQLQTDNDFDIVMTSDPIEDFVIIHDGNPGKKVNNWVYRLRFRVTGEYVCLLQNPVERDFIHKVKLESLLGSDEFVVNDIKIVKRQLWQYRDCFL